MKSLKILTILLLFIIKACSPSEEISNISSDYIDIPDIHFETYLIEQGFDSDGILNARISSEDAEQIKQIQFNNTHVDKVYNLKGIEGFINLEKLIAINQNIHEIDLSNNHKIDTLVLESNHLTYIDLTHNKNLKYVNIASNQLSSIIGISNLEVLDYLNLSYNEFEEITVDNSAIQYLIMTDNSLEAIDLFNAIDLKSLLLQRNKLIAIDVTQNVKLEDLLISDNRFKTIDLSQNRKLKYFYASSTKLNRLDISNNIALVDLRVHQNPDLTCIKIGHNQDILTKVLSDYQNLKTNCN